METIKFGGYKWLVLERNGDCALLLSKDITYEQPYNKERVNITWETCTLRNWLNTEFLNRFIEEEQARIILSELDNPNNLWCRTKGGNNTQDKIFLLNLEEIDKYFGNSGDYLNKRRKQWDGNAHNNGYFLSNSFNADRISKYNGEDWYYWLRSSGVHSYGAANVRGGGRVSVGGSAVNGDGGVRPAMWVRLD